MLKLYISQNLEGKNVVDVSLKSGLYIFKPYTEYYKNANKFMVKEISFEDLMLPYLEQMRKSYEKNKDIWRWFLRQDEVVLGCNCGHRDISCHAYFLADYIFPRIGQARLIGRRD